ncbi:nucleotide-binding protein [Amycolatopsis sp. A133]|uniref:nucleotide-binding protein n=1 Tax=Amycolatopsis sp. A133 TaxID=3064472 RepID=UPI0027EA728D|nr:nucleotide-binding protein [Amycolatopsis sp. A133]MDQ7809671.1 nucleotide-binding protein [Amycolatopsis sp. A133]
MDEQEAKRRRNVFVVHGRNIEAKQAMFEFLRAIDLNPIEWGRARALTKEPNPYIGDILDMAFDAAQAVIVLLTPDEVVSLRPEYADGMSDPDLSPSTQARPNVLFEAGMAMGRHSDRTVLVEIGRMRPFSDVAGRHVLRMGNAPNQRQELVERLQSAGCEVDISGKSDWYQAGQFTVPPEPDFTSGVGAEPSGAGALSATPREEDGWTRSGDFLLRLQEPKTVGFGLYTVLGEAKNLGPRKQMAFITATYSDERGKIIGSANGAVSQIQEDELKTFTLNSNDDLGLAHDSRVQVDSAI